ncbi:TIGR04283 family arsenosugar biosynthesis glycosyltransferase [Aureliella helgolandensis]|uniref:TIGR04283 family arsenosugar biosynthesis glycosyltransferase n=1 Tax=Aureliella helgolandensis TaxID=2527968 RepID=UPI0021BCAC66|nr:TIGR04283 family arsenosugar biosynthesis glycosyltransferase [Aureliella helgolandensis]
MSLAAKEHLLVFARMPEPGNTKTRLIPACGADAAAAISMFLTQKTIRTANRFAASRGCKVTIHFSGGDTRSMREAFGAESDYVVQLGSSLGSRLEHATERSFSTGASRVVVIGTDCLELEEEDLEVAFDALHTNEVVLGPATDGGYYLIGLKHFQPLIFQHIDWGSEFVFAQTKAIAQQCSSSIVELRPLADVDHPEDLLPLRRKDHRDSSGLFNTVPGRLSVIIPTLNEASCLRECMAALGPLDDTLEIIVVDAGSLDETVAIAKECATKTFIGNAGRAVQLNAGAAIASGEHLLFLHADSILPAGYRESIRQCMSGNSIAGAFRLGIASSSPGLRIVEWGTNVRSRVLQLPYGDQGVFMRTSTFFDMGGYRKMPIMEDYELVERLRRRGRIQLLNQTISTSGRRWKKNGIVRTTFLNQLCIAAYKLGVSKNTISKLYNGKRA